MDLRARVTATLLLVLVTSFCLATGSAAEERAVVDRVRLVEIAEQAALEWEARRGPSFEAYVQANGLEGMVNQVDENGMELVGLMEDGTPIIYQIDNHNAARTARVDKLYPGAGYGYDLTGFFMNALGVWDAGVARTSHQEYNDAGFPRVSLGNNNAQLHFHAAHVAGTMVAGGVQATARGMSYESLLVAYDWNNDYNEMAGFANNDNPRISNHSYGQPGGFEWNTSTNAWHWYGNPFVSETEDWQFGYYHSLARDWDQLAHSNPYYTIVKSAGNDRSDTGPGPGGTHYIGPGTGQPSTVDRDRDGGDDGYDCISHRTTAKNIFAIGAVNDVYNYYGPESVNISGFSSYGPTDDGRIKPDIVANGVGLYSTGESSDADYFNSDGTSMSSPSAAGALNLILQQYQLTYGGADPYSTTLRGLAIHTADECGDWVGPDYKFGWGLLNAYEAVEHVAHAGVNPVALQENMLSNGETYTQAITPVVGSPLRVTVMWLDAAGSPLPTNQLNNPSPRLVYDLDLRVVETNTNTTYYPYVLGGLDEPWAPAEPGDNIVDVVEQVYLPDVPAGDYEVRVSHKGFLAEDVIYTLLISGAVDADDVRVPVQNLTGEMNFANGTADLSWELPNPDPSFEEFKIYLDGQLIGTTTNTSYSVNLPDFGTYTLSVGADYAGGESLINPETSVWFAEPVNAKYLGYNIVNEDNNEIRLGWEQSRYDTLAIDDGTGEFPLAFNAGVPEGIIAAQRFNATEDGTLHKLSVYLDDNRPFDEFKMHVLEATIDPMLPGDPVITSDLLLASEEGWFTWQLPNRMDVQDGDQFWIAFEWIASGVNEVQIDQTDENIQDRSVIYSPLSGSWQWEPLSTFLGGFANGDFLIRGVMGVIEEVGENGLVEYAVYRDDNVIGTTDDLFYFETVPDGEHDYYVESVYEQGSAYSETVTIEAGNLDVEDLDIRPTEFEIGDAYPNPFNPTVAVPVTLGAAADVRAVVYDILGRQVAQIAPGRLGAGTHTLNWTAEGVASGVYFLRIQAGPMRSSQKVVLMR